MHSKVHPRGIPSSDVRGWRGRRGTSRVHKDNSYISSIRTMQAKREKLYLVCRITTCQRYCGDYKTLKSCWRAWWPKGCQSMKTMCLVPSLPVSHYRLANLRLPASLMNNHRWGACLIIWFGLCSLKMILCHGLALECVGAPSRVSFSLLSSDR